MTRSSRPGPTVVHERGARRRARRAGRPEAREHGSRLDLSKPNVARTHDALIGGHDSFAPTGS